MIETDHSVEQIKTEKVDHHASEEGWETIAFDLENIDFTKLEKK